MTNPRLHIDVAKIRHNAAFLVDALGARGIDVMGVTKGVLGSPRVAAALRQAGVSGLGDSHVENIEALRAAGATCRITMLRAPMASQAQRVVASCNASLNTELHTMEALSRAAMEADSVHGIVLMVESGDLREGVMPADVMATVEAILALPGLVLDGIGTNLACQNGASPDERNMQSLSELATAIEAHFGIELATVSGGNSANLNWALHQDRGRVNELRLGEAILLGRETLERAPIPGLHTDAFTLHAEVIESKIKPSKPWGSIAQGAFGPPPPATGHGDAWRTLLAVGRQDCNPAGLTATGITIHGASSDHLVIDGQFVIGAEVQFQLNYEAVLQTMTSPFVTKCYHGDVD